MRLEGILLDKDGTLIDFDATWGPAAYQTMLSLSAGDRDRLGGVMRVGHFVESEMRFLPSSPLIAGSSALYGPDWADVLGRPAGQGFYTEMDELFAYWGLRSLSPIHDPAGVLDRLKGQGLRLGIATNDAELSAKAQAEV